MAFAKPRPPIVVENGVARIPLTRGLFALVDEADLPLVSPHAWYALAGKHTHYAVRHVGPAAHNRLAYMHRVLLSAGRGVEVDHIDGNGLDNRRSNIRSATSRQNKQNQVRRRPSKSGFIGVRRVERGETWSARARDNSGRHVHLGTFDSAEAAAMARDAFVRQHRGEFAVTNFPHGTATS